MSPGGTGSGAHEPGLVAHSLLAVIFPDPCPVCRRPIDPRGSHGVCSRCWRAAAWAEGARCLRCSAHLVGEDSGSAGVLCLACSLDPPPFDEGWSPWRYEGEAAEILRLWKYRARPRMASRLARRLLAHRPTADFLAGADALVPVPLHRRRRRQRGFDQAEVLCRALASRLRKPVLRGLRRRRPTEPQVGKGAVARRRNLRGAFAPGHDFSALEGRILCLVDDVWTTGATLEAAARVLRRSRPEALLAFTPARA